MKKYIALTFDDGPNTIVTPAVLERLEKFGIVAKSFTKSFAYGQNFKRRNFR